MSIGDDDDVLRTEGSNDLFTRYWRVPWHAHIVPGVVAALIIVLSFSSSPAQMQSWALSWPAIYRHGIAVLALHLIAHGGVVHVLMNAAALLFVSGPVISRLGRPPLSWARYLYLFIGSGLSGGLLFLALHVGTAASMLGSSGAIFGILGALARIHPATGTVVSVRSVRTWMVAKLFIQNHALLVALVFALAILTNHPVGFAWEAHLGGMLFGFFAAPLFLPESADDTAQPISEFPDT
jgi:membrane associated rhomboid family serine protease